MPDIELLGAVYPDVPAVDLPQSGQGGMVRFYAPSEIKYAGSPTSGGPATVSNGLHYAQVDSTSTSTAYTVTIPGIDSYYDGLTVVLKNGVVTSAANFTVDVNGLGALGVYSNMAAATRETTIFNINYTLMLIYDSTRVSGGCWVNYRGYYSDANSIAYQVRGNGGTLPAKDKFVRYRLLFTSADGAHFVPTNTSTSTNATARRAVNQSAIDPFGRILYYSSTTAIAAGSAPGASYLWSQYQVSLGYSFNLTGAALTLTYPAPVYIKCAPQTNGSAIIDSTTPYVQALPTTADGKIYIFLGIAYNATTIELYDEHPVYCHDGTGIRKWTGKAIPTKTSELTNDSGFLTSAPVTSVNGQTGAVTIPALPAVTSSDNGKVMMVDDGAWAAAEAAGGSTPDIVIRCTTKAFPSVKSNYSIEHGSADAIVAKIQANKPISAVLYACVHDTVEEEWDYIQWHMTYIHVAEDLSYVDVNFSTWGGQQPYYRTKLIGFDQDGNVISVSA